MEVNGGKSVSYVLITQNDRNDLLGSSGDMVEVCACVWNTELDKLKKFKLCEYMLALIAV